MSRLRVEQRCVHCGWMLLKARRRRLVCMNQRCTAYGDFLNFREAAIAHARAYERARARAQVRSGPGAEPEFRHFAAIAKEREGGEQ